MRYLHALIHDVDRACLGATEDEGAAWESLFEDTYFTTDVFPHPDLDSVAWVLSVIEAQPGIWTAAICRMKHDIAGTNEGIAYCGLCLEYANPRKRKRAQKLGPTLPGFDEGAYQLHPACSKRGLTWLRKTLYRLARKREIIPMPKAQIPDLRQIRGYDFATCYTLAVHIEPSLNVE